MSELSTEELIERYLDGALEAEETEALNQSLVESPEVRRELRARVRMHGLMTEHFQLSELEDGGAQLISFPQPLTRTTKRFGLPAIAALLAVLFAVAALFVGISNRMNRPIAEICSSEGATWSNGNPVEVGESLSNERRELDRGLIELELPSGVRIAIEGPATFRMLEPDRMKLEEGQLSAHVPEGAGGFSVDTPKGEVIDLGTRFGIYVDPDWGVQAEVFDGEIEIHRNGDNGPLKLSGGQAVAFHKNFVLASDPEGFPMPRFPLPISLAAGGFEKKPLIEPGIPNRPGTWGGDRTNVLDAQDSITPSEGDQMLQFIGSGNVNGDDTGRQTASEVWQIVDLSDHADEVNEGRVSARLGAQFNRVTGPMEIDTRFGVQILAFRGSIPEAPDYWDRKNDPLSERLSSGGSELISDEDPETWEPANCELEVPSGTDFLLVQIFAFENVSNDDDEEFAGHFADDVTLDLVVSARASRLDASWHGKGDWSDPTPWGRYSPPDPKREPILIIRGEATISRTVDVKQNLVIATGNRSEAKLRIAPGGELRKSGAGQLIVGYNEGAKAELIVQGTLKTRGPVFIGRNNATSLALVDGGTWEAGDGLIRLSQYGDRGPDTLSELAVKNGGRVSARFIELVHDDATLRIESGGEVSAEVLRVGGHDGRARVFLGDGTLRMKRLEFGSGDTSFEWTAPGAILEVGALESEEPLNEILSAIGLPSDQLKVESFSRDGENWSRITRLD